MKYALKDIDIDEFNIKTHLSKIEKYSILIKTKMNQLKELEEFGNNIGCTNLGSVISITNKITDNTSKNAIKKIDLIKSIQEDIVKYTLRKNDIINDIKKLDNTNYLNILMLKYVELLSFEEIAVRLNYSYDYVRKMHKKAIYSLKELI